MQLRVAPSRGPLLSSSIANFCPPRLRTLREPPSRLLVEDLVRLAVDAFLILLGQVAGLLRLSSP
jgi:hypothetical protein